MAKLEPMDSARGANVDRFPAPWRAAALITGLLGSACSVGPDWRAPSVEVPEGWDAAAAELDGFSTSPVEMEWWRQFGDEQLTRYIEEAVRANLDLEVARTRVREARALHGVAAADLWPAVDAGGSYTRTRITENGPGPLSRLAERGLAELDQELFRTGFDASWEIDVFGSRRRAVEAAVARLEAAVENRRDVLLSVVAEVGRNYAELRGAQRRLAVARRNIEVQEESLSLVERRHEAGLAPEMDLVRARARLERTRAIVPPLRAALRAGAHRLAVLTGRQPRALLEEMAASRPLPDLPELVALGLPGELVSRRPDVRRAERELRAATADVGVATGDLYPRFFLIGSAGFESAKLSNLFDPASGFGSIGPSISWPIFQGGRVHANIEASEARLEAALARFRRAVLRALEEADTALVRYLEARAERDRLAEAVRSERRALELATVLYEQGVRDFLSVLDVEEALTELEDRLARARTEVVVRLLALYKALGGGWKTLEERDRQPVR